MQKEKLIKRILVSGSDFNIMEILGTLWSDKYFYTLEIIFKKSFL